MGRPKVYKQQSSYCELTENVREPSRVAFIKALISFNGAPSLSTNDLPKAPPQNTITLRIRIQYMNFGGTLTFSP